MCQGEYVVGLSNVHCIPLYTNSRYAVVIRFWISENDDFFSQIQLEGCTCISEGKRRSSSGGLIIYADSRYNYELLEIPNEYTGWEGHLIKNIRRWNIKINHNR